MIRGLGNSVVDAVHGQVAVPTALIEDRLFGRPGEAADALKADDPSAGTAFGRSFGTGVAPAGGGIAGAGAGAAVGSEIGGLFGPLGGAVGGFVGGVGGGMLGGAKVAEVQDELLQRLLSPQAREAMEIGNRQITESQPLAQEAGQLAAQALFARPSLSLARRAMAQRAAGGAVAGGIDAAQQQINTGQVDVARVARQAAGGALLSGGNTVAGEALQEAGAALARPAGKAGAQVLAPGAKAIETAAIKVGDKIVPERVFKDTLLTPEKALQIADDSKDWKDWYSRHEPIVQEVFGNDAPLFSRLLAATSQASNVKGNITLALKAYKQLKSGEEFSGYLPAVASNLERVRKELPLNGPKISEYDKALAGDPNGVAVDRHVAETIFGTKKPTAEQIAHAKRVIAYAAKKKDWKPSEVQSVFWAHNQTRQGRTPTDYRAGIEQRRDNATALRAAFAGGDRAGVQQGSGTGRPAEGSGVPEGSTGSNRGPERSGRYDGSLNNAVTLYSGIDPRFISEGLRVLGGTVVSKPSTDGQPVSSPLENVSTLRKAGLQTQHQERRKDYHQPRIGLVAPGIILVVAVAIKSQPDIGILFLDFVQNLIAEQHD
ncbi:MAG: hypothetical protein V4671_25615, partial [Armatimonadota bacterium]